MNNKKQKVKYISLLLVLIFLAANVFSACSLFGLAVSSVRFTVDQMEINIGDTINIGNYLEIAPAHAVDKSFSLESSDEAIVKTEDMNIYALSEGEVTLKATTNLSSKSATCIIKVTKIEPKSINVAVNGELYQTKPDFSYIDFYADFDGSYLPHKNVEWTIDDGGQIIETKVSESAEPFSYIPSKTGKYKVKAKVTDSDLNVFEDEKTVYAYEDYINKPVFTHTGGALSQDSGAYSQVSFKADYTDAVNNPDRAIEWKVNGETYGSDKIFIFTPQNAGEYKIELFIDEQIFGQSSLTAGGAVTPLSLRADFDNCYPDVFVYWDMKNCAGYDFNYVVSVFDASGALIKELNSNNTSDKGYFKEGSVNLGAFIGEKSAKNIFTNEFTIKVKSLGSTDGIFTASEFETVKTAKVAAAAKNYLSKKYNDLKNFYLTDSDEFTEILGYIFMWRSNAYKESTSNNNIYAGFGLDSAGLTAMVNNSYYELHITGQALISYNIKNSVITLNITFKTDTLPSKSSTGTSSDYIGGTEFGASRPHINYDSQLKRGALPIESSSKMKINVETSEQLYYIASLKYCPVPKAGSKAQEIYDYAKNVLLNIITLSMSDAEKAHAIYDWLMYRVNYDYALTAIKNMSIADSVKYNAYYLEGVFSDDRPYAVCDGIAKTYALMCNLENIDCVRVAGIAGAEYNTSSWAGHAWNKVKIDGKWYIVDATWGDETISFKGKNITAKYYESAMHRYFLLTDKQLEKNRMEEKPNDYPRTALSEYNWYDDDVDYNGSSIDFYFNGTSQNVSTEAEKLAQYIKTEVTGDNVKYKNDYASKIAGSSPLQKNCRYIAFDIRINYKIANMFTQLSNNPFSNKLKTLMPSYDIYYALDTRMLSDSYLYVFIYK